MKYNMRLLKGLTFLIAALAISSSIAGCNDDHKSEDKQSQKAAHSHPGDDKPHVHGDCTPGKFPCDSVNFLMYNAPIAGFNLEKEIGLTARNVRLRYWIIAPGGRIGQHYHDKRPAIVYFLEGEAIETKRDVNGDTILRTMRGDEAELESSGITHWWVNQSKKMVKLFAVDIVPDNLPGNTRCSGIPRTSPFAAPATPDNVKTEDLGAHDLARQFPEAKAVKDYSMRGRRITILPGQKTGLVNSKGKPSITYVVRGDGLEHRDDEETSIRRAGDCTTASGGVSYYWENVTSDPVVLFVVDFVKKTI